MNTVSDDAVLGQPKSAPPKSVKSATRALEIVELVAGQDGMSLTDVMTALELPKSSAHALLSTLEAEEWLRRDRYGAFKLGVRAWILGRSKSAEGAWMNELSDVLSQITAETHETTQFSILDGAECVYLAVNESPQPMSLYSRVGSRLHAHATASGKAMFSALEGREYERAKSALTFERFTEATITEADKFDEVISVVRENLFATEVEEYVPNSICVSMAVDLRESLGFLGAVSVTMPGHRRPSEWPESVLPALRRGTARLEELARD